MSVRLEAPRRDSVHLEEWFRDEQILMFDPRLERSAEALVTRIREIDPTLDAFDAIVIRGSDPALHAEVEGDAALSHYLESLPVFVLAPAAMDKSLRLSQPSWAQDSSSEIDLEGLRSAELMGMLRRSPAIYRNAAAHYQLPSASVHAEEFIRVADALQDPIDLIRLADWILPALTPDCGLVADTGSLLALLATLQSEAQRRLGYAVELATLNEYPEEPQRVEELLDNLEAKRQRDLVCLVTVSSTGSLARQLRAARPQAKIIVLVETAESADPKNDTFLSYEVARWPIDATGRCEMCPQRQTLVIDPVNYEVRADLQFEAEGFDTSVIQREKAFWEAADTVGAIRLHVDQPPAKGSRRGGRHLGVHLDVGALLGHPEIEADCIRALEQVPKPDVVLMPDHDCREELQALVRRVWPDVSCRAVSLSGNSEEIAAALSEAETVLVVDDVLISGQTLARLRLDISKAESTMGRELDAWAFVVVSRPPSRDELQRTRRTWSSAEGEGPPKGQLLQGAEVMLPPPGQQACPWCRERDLFETLAFVATGSVKELAEERSSELTGSPLGVPLVPGGLAKGTKTQASIFGALSPAPAFAAASSHAQRRKDTFSHRQQANTIQTFNVRLLVDAIWEATILGGTLRTLDPRDCRDHARDGELAEALSGKEADLAMAWELALAAAEDKLPREGVRALISRLEGTGEQKQLLLAVTGDSFLSRAEALARQAIVTSQRVTQALVRVALAMARGNGEEALHQLRRAETGAQRLLALARRISPPQ